MDATHLVWVGIGIIVALGVLTVAVIWAGWRFHVFTAATEASTVIVLQTHQQNMLIEQEVFNIAHDLAHVRARHQPPQSEDCVA